MTHTHSEKIPREILLGAAGLVAISLMAATVSRLTGIQSAIPESTALVVRDLRFEDMPDGSVNVIDATSAQAVNRVSPGADAFVRATLRGLAQQRKREALGGEVPFRLTAWADGRLTLDDSATGRHVELEAFGSTNEAAFARLLTPRTVE
jgi:putative photosynthetic complex assembly protein